MAVRGLFSSPSANIDAMQYVNNILTSGQQKVTPVGVDNAVTVGSNNSTMVDQKRSFTPKGGNDKECISISEGTHKSGAMQSFNTNAVCKVNDKNDSLGQDQDLTLLYDVNGFDDDKFTNIVGNVFGNQNDMKLDREYGPYFSLWH